MKVLRTPEDRFADLPDFGYPPRYAEVGGLRLAYVETGPADGEPVLLLHGEPSWSFLYRKVMPVLADAGLRAIAADLVGFGRSDKPAEIGDHSFAGHVEWIRAFAFDHLDLRGLTIVGQDWGGLIGLRLVAEHPDRFARVVAANTGLPTGDQPMPDVWLRFREVVRTAPALSDLLGGQIPLIWSTPNSLMQYIQTGKIKPLAVASPKRIAILPDVPTVSESGFAGFDVTVWYGMAAPAKTPPDVVARVGAALADVDQMLEVQQKLTPLGYDLRYVDSRHFAEKIANDHARYGKVIRDAGITPD